MAGRHFLQIPGPTNVPDRVLRAMDLPVIDHRGPSFGLLGLECIEGMKRIFKTKTGKVFLYPASGTGSWEAAIVNTLNPGDKVLMFETGQFAVLWKNMAVKFGLEVEFTPGDWRHGIDPAQVESILRKDSGHKIKAVMAVHNETSTGITSSIKLIREAMDRAGHPALLMVDAVSSLCSTDYQHDAWRVDVTAAGSQKGLMLPPGMGFNAVSDKALTASKSAKLPRSFWSWDDMAVSNQTGYFPYTPAISMLLGLRETVKVLEEEGLDNVLKRHERLAEATRRAVKAWGLELLCLEPSQYSAALTAVMLPEGFDEAKFRRATHDAFNISLGAGLGKIAGKVFRIGHLGDQNDLMVCGALCGIEMGLERFGVPFKRGGVAAALDFLKVQ